LYEIFNWPSLTPFSSVSQWSLQVSCLRPLTETCQLDFNSFCMSEKSLLYGICPVLLCENLNSTQSQNSALWNLFASIVYVSDSCRVETKCYMVNIFPLQMTSVH